MANAKMLSSAILGLAIASLGSAFGESAFVPPVKGSTRSYPFGQPMARSLFRGHELCAATTDDGMHSRPMLSNDYLPAETLERSKVGNKFEKVKSAKPGDTMFTEVHELAAAVRSGKFTWEELDIDDADIRLKWAGMFHRRKKNPGTFMMRLKVPNGVLTTEQLRYAAKCVEKYDRSVGVIDITTRMNLQLRGITLGDSSDVINGFYERGLTTLMSGMDNVRNMVGSPIAGIDPLELVDTRPLCDDINNMITNKRKGNAALANFPRKVNIAISGSRDDFAHTMINDLGLQPVAHPESGEMGFNVVVGGFFSIKRVAESIPMDLWIKPEDAVNLSKSMLLKFRDLGPRKDRQKSRLMYMVEEMGMPAFREVVVSEMRKSDPDFAALGAAPAPTEPFQRRDILGVHPQKQEGMSWVCVATPAGRLMPEEALMAADVADQFSGSEVRLTVDQRVLFPNVPTELVPKMLEMPFFKRFPVDQGVIASRVVSCPGSQYCGFGLVETKNKAMEVAVKLEELLDFPEGSTIPRIHWTGCPNSCGQAQVGDIGLMGGPAKLDGKAVEGVNIFLGGGVGETHSLGEIAMKGIPAAEESLVPVLRDICIERFGAVPKAATRRNGPKAAVAAVAKVALGGATKAIGATKGAKGAVVKVAKRIITRNGAKEEAKE
ncbi:unnamed protein product [Choristocarpus tenellus]